MSKSEKNNLPMKIIQELTKTLDISKTMHEDAESKYQAVAKFLGESDNPLLHEAHIYPQGSIRLGTVVKPMNQEEFDIDLVIHLPHVTPQTSSNVIHESIGKRLLSEDSIYKDKTVRLNRGWRIEYANNFHLDITPAIENMYALAEEYRFSGTAEFVPDKKLQDWKDSNPRGFAQWFDEIDDMLPNLMSLSMESYDSVIAKNYQVDDIPEYNGYKGLLKRVVQILKKHRDIYFSSHETLSDYRPISIVLTTLAARSYREIVESQKPYIDPYDLMIDIINGMGTFIEVDSNDFSILNPTNSKENFAEKWNTNKLYSTAFRIWQNKALVEIKNIKELQGLDKVHLALESSFGSKNASLVRDSLNQEVKNNRELGLLAPVIINTSEANTKVKENNFFGKH